MIFTEKIQRAIKFAIKTHDVYQKQKRRGKDVAFITHPLTVGIILSRVKASEDVIAAGILHDTIEDCVAEKKVDKKMIKERFGKKVAELVVSVTESNRSESWEKRKEKVIKKIPKYSRDSLLIKSADIVSNMSELVSDHNRFGDQIFKYFNVEKEKLLQHYMNMSQLIIQVWKNNPIKSDLKRIIKELKRIS